MTIHEAAKKHIRWTNYIDYQECDFCFEDNHLELHKLKLNLQCMHKNEILMVEFGKSLE